MPYFDSRPDGIFLNCIEFSNNSENFKLSMQFSLLSEYFELYYNCLSTVKIVVFTGKTVVLQTNFSKSQLSVVRSSLLGVVKTNEG